MRGQKVLVTGGAGYVGSHVLLALEKQDCETTVIDNLSTGKRGGVCYGKLLEEDLGNTPFLENLMKKEHFDSIIHLAGSIVVPESVRDPLTYYRNNTKNALDLMTLAVKHKVKHFLFSSTAAVYGIPEDGICDEETPTRPISPYGKSKLMTEWMLDDVCKAHDLNYIALRYFNVAGANREGRAGQCSPLATHLIKVACETAYGKRKKMVVFGDDYDTPDGTCVRDYIHVDDLANAHVAALDYLSKKNHSLVVNCGYGRGFSVKEVLAKIQELSPTPFEIEMGERRPGDAPFLVAKSEKIREILAWEPQYDGLDFICKTALEWEGRLK